MKFKHQWAVLLLLVTGVAPMTAMALECGYPCDLSKKAEMKQAVMAKTPGAATAENANKAIASAEVARKRAASVDSEWRDTGKFIKQAKAAAKKSDFAKAIKLATKAAHEGNLGYEQGASQSKLRIPSYLKY